MFKESVIHSMLLMSARHLQHLLGGQFGMCCLGLCATSSELLLWRQEECPLAFLLLPGPKKCSVPVPPATLKYTTCSGEVASGQICSVSCVQPGYIPRAALTAARCNLGAWTPATGSCGECDGGKP